MKLLAAVIATSAAFTIAAGCGGIDTDKAEDLFQGLVEEAAPGATVTSVTCPDDIENKTGTSFECSADLDDGTTVTGTCTVTDEDEGRVECLGEDLELSS
jgi:hypothetical protein